MKNQTKRFKADFDTTVAGIPCGVQIISVDGKDSDPSNDASDWDNKGWIDLDFDILDRQGYLAPWLQAKMTNKDIARIKGEILEFMKEEQEA